MTNLAEKRFPISRTHNEPLIPKELIPDRNLEIERIKKENKDLEEKELEKLIKEKIKDYEKEILLYEERRLFYVAITRTKKELYLTFARSYNSEENSSRESVFLQEINYQKNPIIEFLGEDNDNLSTIIAPDTKLERYKQNIKEQLIDSLDTDDISSIIKRLSKYFTLRENNLEEINNLEEKIKSINLDKKELEDDLIKYQDNKNSLVFNKEEFTFSPSAINTYLECPKKFELRHIYQMPEIGSLDELLDLEHGKGSALDKGSFLHKILEIYVKDNKKTEKELEEIAKDLLKTDNDFLDKISEDDYK
jgi:DNA helicase-2/ATP-dependent DNA helicase PcrA